MFLPSLYPPWYQSLTDNKAGPAPLSLAGASPTTDAVTDISTGTCAPIAPLAVGAVLAATAIV